MSSSINLVSNKNDELELKNKRLRIVRVLAIISLSLVAFSAILVFILNATVPLASIKKDEATTITNISYLQSKAAKLYLINDRINNINNISSSRKNYVNFINTVLKKLPTDLSIDTFTIDQKDITLTVSGPSLLSINQFFDAFVSLGNTGKIINSVSVQNLVLNVNSGKYSLSFQAHVL